MKIFNSLSKKIEVLKPIKTGKVGLYTCGPTVYDHVHIGNLRTYVFEDTLRRTLKAEGYSVNHVMNITDVDDKTIKRSREKYADGEPIDALKKLTTEYEHIFLEDAKKIAIDLSGSTIARATSHIDEMRQIIEKISNKYLGDDGIYYDITKDPDYGVLVKLDRSHEHHRINNDEYDKDHVADFALWKKASPGEPSWDFQMDEDTISGRPGWHIECSAMSVKFLGQPFDIHTGGVDLKFPHHENEIAQSRAAGGDKLANYFMHAEHLLVDGHKMSKKLKNFYTLADVEQKGFEPLALRLLFLQAHYRSQLNFTWESLEAAAANLKALENWSDLVHQNVNSLTAFKAEPIIKAFLEDLNTPQALAHLNEQINAGAAPTKDILEKIDNCFGLELADRGDITKELKDLIAERQSARDSKDWKKSDELREKLKVMGIELKDTGSGQVWSRI